jgi:hypothetical protein
MENAVNILIHTPEPEAQLQLPRKSQCHLTSHPTSHPPEPAPNPPARFETGRAEEKQRAKSLLSQLNQDQTVQLMEWLGDQKLSLPDIRDLVATAPPEGFGIKTHINTLHRLRAGLRSVNAIARIENMLETTADVAESTDLSRLTAVQAVISHLLHAHAFHLADETPGSEVLTRVLTGIEKLSALEHKRQLLVLAREKLQANSSATARRHHVDLNIVRQEGHHPNQSS